MTARAIVVVTALLAMAPVRVDAQGLQTSAGVDSARYLVGDWISVHVRFLHPAGTGLQPAFGDTVGPFTVVRLGSVEHLGATESRAVVVLARYDSGATPIPPLVFFARVPGDSAALRLATEPIPVVVSTVPVDTSAEIRDIKPPVGIPWAIWELASLAGFLASLAMLALHAVRAWKERKNRPAPAEAPAPPVQRPAHEIALQKLGALRERKLWEQGLVKPYYSEVTEIVREYIELRFRTRALEQTTDEILEGLRVFAFPAETAAPLERLLRVADLVKFAKHQPSLAEHPEAMAAAQRFVELTRQRPAPPSPPDRQRKALHVGT